MQSATFSSHTTHLAASSYQGSVRPPDTLSAHSPPAPAAADEPNLRTPDMLYPKPVRFLTLGLRGLRVCEREAHSKLSAGKHRVGLVQRLAKGFGDSRPMG